MNTKDDFYAILGVDYFAGNAELRNAYLSKIKFYHPDKFAGSKNFAEDMTAKINVAYATLKDYDKRKRYDFENGIVEKRNKILWQKRKEAEIKQKQQNQILKQREKEKKKLQKIEAKKQKQSKKNEVKKTVNNPQKYNKIKDENSDKINADTQKTKDNAKKTAKKSNIFNKITKIFAKSEKKNKKENEKKENIKDKTNGEISMQKKALTTQEKKERKSVLIERIVLDSIIIGLVLAVILILIFH